MTTVVSKAGEHGPVDWDELISRVGDDEELIKEVADAWLMYNPARLTALDEAVKTENSKVILSLAHVIKGSAATISANSLAEAASCLEIACREEKLENKETMFVNIKKEFAKVELLLSQANWVEISKQQANKKEMFQT